MKVKRRKIVKRILDFYGIKFGFREPYQVLLDGTFLHSAVSFGHDVSHTIANYFGRSCRVFVSPGVIRELQLLGDRAKSTLEAARRLAVAKGVAGPDASARECIRAIIGTNNASHYVVGTLDKELAKELRNVVAVPVLYLNRDVYTLEQPSYTVENAAKQLEADKMAKGHRGPVSAPRAAAAAAGAAHPATEVPAPRPPAAAAAAAAAGAASGAATSEPASRKRQRKGPSGPNPLSVKKAKKAPPRAAGSAPKPDGAGDGKKTRRGGRKKRAGEGGSAAAAGGGASEAE